MIVSPYCKKLDMAIRLLTVSQCGERNGEECEFGLCEHFSTRLSAPLGM